MTRELILTFRHGPYILFVLFEICLSLFFPILYFLEMPFSKIRKEYCSWAALHCTAVTLTPPFKPNKYLLDAIVK